MKENFSWCEGVEENCKRMVFCLGWRNYVKHTQILKINVCINIIIEFSIIH